ncbi:MarC family protein [Marispirochaeta aestuarii]|jgi:multiple antibiotic resistance protein|uniref:MarC family protein n=1 Tax=Marispirochaeta aestuarii TaxID=1963862 RepID=UPI0029C6CA17|nr:MarC family protein [Marispirochaeta aestuarii]
MIINSALFLTALINPISKIAVISMLPESASMKDVEKIALRSSLVAFAMLIVFALGGNLLFKSVFHIELYSFQSVGGFVVFFYGFMALRQGVFFEVSSQQKLLDLSIVPIASPLIAGPATITAVITLSAEHHISTVIIALALALGLNLVAMLLSRVIAKPLIKFNVMGALIRITGLFVASIGVDMMFTGIRSFVQTL